MRDDTLFDPFRSSCRRGWRRHSTNASDEIDWHPQNLKDRVDQQSSENINLAGISCIAYSIESSKDCHTPDPVELHGRCSRGSWATMNLSLVLAIRYRMISSDLIFNLCDDHAMRAQQI